MNDGEIEIIVDLQGKVTIRTIGIKGKECLKVAEALAEIVGNEESRQLTQEFYENSVEATNTTSVHQRYM